MLSHSCLQISCNVFMRYRPGSWSLSQDPMLLLLGTGEHTFVSEPESWEPVGWEAKIFPRYRAISQPAWATRDSVLTNTQNNAVCCRALFSMQQRDWYCQSPDSSTACFELISKLFPLANNHWLFHKWLKARTTSVCRPVCFVPSHGLVLSHECILVSDI